MTSTPHADAAGLLLEAYETGVPSPPLTALYPTFDVADAYQVQSLQLDRWTTQGRTVAGRKVGLTSPAMQAQLGVDQPDFGVLLSDRGHRSGDVLDTARFISPRAEPELAFVLSDRLRGPGVTVSQAVAAISVVCASLEIIDSRIVDWRIGLVDTVADNASFGAYVLDLPGVAAGAVDLAAVRCQMSRNGQVVSEGTSDAVVGSPVNALVWLANTLGARGVALEAGHVVLPGSITAAVPVEAGDTVTATFSGVGTVTAHFS